MRSISSMNLCRRFKAAGIMTLSPTVRDLIDAALFVVDPYCHGSRAAYTGNDCFQPSFYGRPMPTMAADEQMLGEEQQVLHGGRPATGYM